jgi:glycosyltransferase involved in cell wall biosynthesis
VTLVVFGNVDQFPEYGSRLRDLAADSDKIQFRGTYSHEETAKVFAEIDILAVPSLWYDFPLIIQEAFATNTPVIATDLGGMAEAVEHDFNGLLFERNNVNELALLLTRFLKEPDLLSRLQEGIPPVKTIQDEVAELELIYRRLTEQKLTADQPSDLVLLLD